MTRHPRRNEPSSRHEDPSSRSASVGAARPSRSGAGTTGAPGSTPLRLARVFAGILVLLSVVAAGCVQTPGPGEELESFVVTAPDSVTAGTSFSLTVTAVGSQGSQPFTEFSGAVTLTVSSGSIAPSSVSLTDGEITADVTLSGVTGSATITATAAGASGSTTVSVAGQTSLPGPETDPATEAIPAADYAPSLDGFEAGHPELGDTFVSVDTILLAFTLDTTVGEANDLLEEIDAQIVGGLPGAAGEVQGILALRVPTTSHEEMTSLVAMLEADARVHAVSQDTLLETTAIPAPNGGDPANWTWDATPSGGNFGLELIRAPQLWNLNAAIEKTGRTSVTGVLDVGFADSHPDLEYLDNQTPGNPANHGTHVAGTIGATYDNGIGVDGVNPFADLVIRTRDDSGIGGSTTLDVRESFGDAHIFGLFDLLNSRSDLRAINISLGYNWGPAGVDQDNNTSAQRLVERQGGLFGLGLLLAVWFNDDYGGFDDLPVIAVAAGNDSDDGFGTQDARWSSPFTYAALDFGLENVLVVESVANDPTATGGATRSNFSNIGGHIAAPGTDVTSTVTGDGYATLSGTSMAAPHVSGLVGYLAALDPSLTPSEIRDVLTGTAVAVDGGASDRIDAFAAVLDIDRVQAGTSILAMLLDIDDGTPDGNQRTLVGSSSDFTGEDADGDGGIGDGTIDMADFRRWRDWLLQTENAPGLDLDGSTDHPKKDVNGNGTVESPGEENLYPRGDFNGDGALSRSATSFVPGAIAATVTDLAVLQDRFTGDANYAAGDLPGLIDSADIEVWPSECLERADVASVTSSVFLEGGGDLPDYLHTHTSGDPRYVYTVPEATEGHTVLIEARDSGGNVAYDTTAFVDFTLGSDTFLDPICSDTPPAEPGGARGGSWGDPHQITFDGMKYDFQAVGEFIFLVTDYTDTIQVRQEPWGGSTRVSVNTAVATEAGGQRVALYVDESTPLWIDGAPTPLGDGASISLGSAAVFRAGDAYTVVYASDLQLIVTLRSGRMDIDVALPSDHLGAVAGLLGDADGDTGNDLALRDGTELSQPIAFDTLYGGFADSWRISQAESLFDYASGEDTNTFTDTSFPSTYASTGDLTVEAYDLAHATCEEAGVTDPIVLDACILDVAVTGDAGFAQDSAAAEQPSDELDLTPPTRNIALLHGTNDSAAIVYETQLEQRGFVVELVVIGSTASSNASSLAVYDALLIDTFSGNLDTWEGDEKVVNAVLQSGRPVLGIGEGGYAFFGRFGSPIGLPEGAHGSMQTTFAATSPLHPAISGPRSVTVASGEVTFTSSASTHASIFLGDAPASLEIAATLAGDDQYAPAIFDPSPRHGLWGFHGDPSGYTGDGWNTVANMVSYLLGLP